MRRLAASLAMLAVGCLLAAAAARTAHRGPAAKPPNGGTFRVAFTSVDSLDPALAYTAEAWDLLYATCARLMNYRDRPPPAGLRLVPEVAAASPTVSKDGRTYTFRLRSGFRFSDGTPVRATSFARQINRTLTPGISSPALQYTGNIVGADDVLAGRAPSARGVVAAGNRLVVRLKHPVPDFPAWTTMPFFCAVPPALPSDPEGVGAFPSAGPYYVSQWVLGERVVLLRNRFYRGARPHHVDGFDVDLRAGSPAEVLDRVERGEADWGRVPPPVYVERAKRLIARYGVNRSRFFLKPGLVLNRLVLNTSRPLFRNNLRLRRAINFAVDRAAVQRNRGGLRFARLTDQYLPPSLPGFRDANIYPLRGADLRRARALARGRTRSGKAIFYTFDVPETLADAQIIARNLKKIGLKIEIRGLSPPALYARLTTRGSPFDIAFLPWGPDYLDPYTFINTLLDGRLIRARGNTNVSYYNSPKFNRLMARAARLQGDARYAAYGKLDVTLARDAAPMLALSYDNEPTLVSKRVGCVVLRPSLDLTAVCLKR